MELEREDSKLQDAILGRREKRRKTLFQSVAQLWRNHSEPEVRNPAAKEKSGVTKRDRGGVVRIYLPDVSAVIENYQTAQLKAGQWFGELAALGAHATRCHRIRGLSVHADGNPLAGSARHPAI